MPLPTIQELRESRSGLLTLMRESLASAETEGRDLTDEERATYDGYEAKIEKLDQQITQREGDLKRRERMDALAAAAEKSRGRQTQASQPGAPVAVEVKNLAENDPKRGFKDHREFLLAAMDAARYPNRIDDRLKPLAASNWRQAAAGSDEQSTFSDPYGGFLLPPAFMPSLMSLTPEDDPIAPFTTKMPMTSAVVNIPARVDKNHTSSVSGGLRVYRRQEADDTTSSRMEMEQVQLVATMLMGVAYATEELLQRSPLSFVALLESAFRDEFAATMIRERLLGTGAGEFEGLLNAPCLITISKETGQSASTIVYDNVIKMRARCWKYSRAIWLANHDTLPQLQKLVLTIGTGGVNMWQPSAREGEPDLLLGRPIYFTEYCKTLGTVGDIMLGVWSEFLEGTLTPFQQADSLHVRFLNHQRCFKVWMENAGRWWWRSALTVAQGSNTLSPTVVLATRS